ncbi:prolyl oligopeptidase family serine peptidase [Kutzneria albida]|uniref:Peptidase S9 prolyl oligopeptidase active site domain protein n=1 Tax=Kutzneria albida DSM 43870 TaxID=1449976 RepID=W5VXS9_9PSEU|nr:prolyl oligopeptidase family serine peptidase [Kutzneria albida]AHH93658.1 peptidase S9 prolyl oligopeptidase active site domain protein [Kutzneria albida DSM 43870]
MTTTHPAAQVPDRLFDDPEAERRWRARFTAHRVSLPDWALEAPDRCLYVSNASGVWEIYAWDRSTDTHRQVTDRPNGTSHATVSPDGEQIWWFNDTDGDEFGSWVVEPYGGLPSGSTAQPAVPGVHDGYPAGLQLGLKVTAVGASTDDGTTIWVTRGGPAEVVYTSEHDGGVSALSRDETLLAISHSEHGDSRHPALRVITVDGAETVAEKWDGEGKGLDAIAFCPVAGDSRLLVSHERRGREELLIWDVRADTETELVIDLPGEVSADWYTDGRALLIAHTHQSRNTLHRYDLDTHTLSTLHTPNGTIGSAGTRPDGTVEYSWSNASRPSVVRALFTDGTDRVLLEPPGEKAPHSEPLTDAFVPTTGGEVHALVARPADAPEGPLPTVFAIHGGPHAADEDRFSAYRAVWLDAGFAVVHVNYRGSTGYGSVWRDAIEGRPGLTELEDIAAVQDWAVASGLADPARCVINGASWGGYLSLLALGVQPERWAAGVAGVPVADYVAAYEDEMEPLRAFDRALFGGSPQDLPELYEQCSPLTYVDQVRAPLIVLAGENDPRCPIRQIDNYLDRLAERGAPYEVYRYEAGHGSLVVAETIKQTAIEVDFTRRVLG